MNELNDFNKYLKEVSKIEPHTLEGLNNTSYFYYFYKLYKMVCSIFTYDSLPDNWNLPYINENLIIDGNICVTETPAGTLPLRSGFSGHNYFNQPTDFIIANEVLGNFDGKIGTDGVMVYMDIFNGGYRGLSDTISRYATLLSSIDGSFNTTLINSRVAMLFKAKNKAQLKTMEKVYDQVSSGKPAVFIRDINDDFEYVTFNNVKTTYIGTELLNDKRTVINEFLTDIGINNVNTQKRERLITGEVNGNDSELLSNIEVFDYNLSNGWNQVKTLYNIDVGYHLNDKIIKQYQDQIMTSNESERGDINV